MANDGKPARPSVRGRSRLIVAGLALLIALPLGFWAWQAWPSPAERIAVSPHHGGGPVVPPIDETAARAHAWGRAEPLLAQAERESAQALDKHLASVHDFLSERKQGARRFAEQLLSLRGKWELVKSQVCSDGDQEYARFLADVFAEHLFQGDELQQVVAAAIRGYLSELEGIEARLLIRLRADLSEDELPLLAMIPSLRSDDTLARHYHELSDRLARDLTTDLVIVAGRETLVWEGTTIVTDLTIKVGAAVAARLGISTAILSGGAASSWVSFGVGIVVAIVLDAVVNQIIKVAGYDAEERVAERVGETLDSLGRTITDGDPEARDALAQIKQMERDDPDAEVRGACTKAIARIEAGCQLFGLRGELTKIGAARASLRKEALRHLIHDSEVTP